MWQDANPGKEMTMEEQKTLEQGCSTALVAALDPRIAGSFYLPIILAFMRVPLGPLVLV